MRIGSTILIFQGSAQLRLATILTSRGSTPACRLR
jgi:hypothetical protein